jgi:hypothetical protein
LHLDNFEVAIKHVGNEISPPGVGVHVGVGVGVPPASIPYCRCFSPFIQFPQDVKGQIGGFVLYAIEDRPQVEDGPGLTGIYGSVNNVTVDRGPVSEGMLGTYTASANRRVKCFGIYLNTIVPFR